MFRTLKNATHTLDILDIYTHIVWCKA